jgi:hypothetical protein
MKLIATLGLALGVATIVGGSLAFAFGLSTTDTIVISGVGPFAGFQDKWHPTDYCFLGAILAAVGAGLVVFCLTWVVLIFRHGQSVFPRWRWLLWSLVLALGVAGVSVGATALLTTRGPRVDPGSMELARTQVVVFLVRTEDGKDTSLMTTPEFQQRAQARKQSVRYDLTRYRITSTVLQPDGHITVSGSITAAAKTTSTQIGRTVMIGAAIGMEAFDPPKEIAFTAQLVKGPNGNWLIEELAMQE